MKKHLFILVLLPILLALVSCSSDDSTSTGATNAAADYLPLKVGNYWIYENRTVDTSGAISSVVNYDSVVVTASGTYFGKSGYMTLTYNETTGLITDTSYFAIENNCIYKYYQSIKMLSMLSQFGVSFAPNITWVKLADYSGLASWTIIDTTVANLPITYTGITKVDLAFKIAGSSVGAGSLSTEFGNYSAAEQFLNSAQPTFNVGTFLGTYPIAMDIKTNYWFVKNTGLVKIFQPQAKATYNPAIGAMIEKAGMSSFLNLPGSQSVLVRSKIN